MATFIKIDQPIIFENQFQFIRRQQFFIPNNQLINSKYSLRKSIHLKRTKHLINFDHAFRPIYYMSRVFGLMPFTIHYDSNGIPQKLIVRHIDWIIFLIFIIISLTITYDGFQAMDALDNYNLPFIHTFYGKFYQLVIMISSATIIVLNMYNRYRFMFILTNFTTFDKNVSFS